MSFEKENTDAIFHSSIMIFGVDSIQTYKIEPWNESKTKMVDKRRNWHFTFIIPCFLLIPHFTRHVIFLHSQSGTIKKLSNQEGATAELLFHEKLSCQTSASCQSQPGSCPPRWLQMAKSTAPCPGLLKETLKGCHLAFQHRKKQREECTVSSLFSTASPWTLAYQAPSSMDSLCMRPWMGAAASDWVRETAFYKKYARIKQEALHRCLI